MLSSFKPSFKLIKAGADVNRRAQDGTTTPLSCCFYNQRGIASRCAVSLLEAGAEIDSLCTHERTLSLTHPHSSAVYLSCAIKTNDARVVAALLQRGADPDTFVGPDQSALHYMVNTCASTEIINLLLIKGADPNQHLPDGPILHRVITTCPEVILISIIPYSAVAPPPPPQCPNLVCS